MVCQFTKPCYAKLNCRVPDKFLSDPGIPGPIYGSKCLEQTGRGFADLTDVTLADEDNNSILTDNANRAM